MSEVVFIKLGGSLITDKQAAARYRPDVVREFGRMLQLTLTEHPNLRVLLGHGSGSFGHIPAARHGTRQGVAGERQWRGYTEVARAASRLNQRVWQDLSDCDLPVISCPPSASAICSDGRLREMSWLTLRAALARGLVPLIFGDVALDERRGGTIVSTEELFAFLARPLSARTLLLLGDEPGVLDAGNALIPRLTPVNFPKLAAELGGSAGVDVTGGMLGKVKAMLALVAQLPELSVRIMSGRDQAALRAALISAPSSETAELPGTLIAAE